MKKRLKRDIKNREVLDVKHLALTSYRHTEPHRKEHNPEALRQMVFAETNLDESG